MSYDNYSNLFTEQQMIAEAKKFVNDSVDAKLDKSGGTMTGSIVTTSNTAIKPQTHDTGTVGELNNHYAGGYFNTIHVKGSNANGSYGIELSGAEDAGTIEFAKEADSDESYRQVFQNKDGTLALTSDIEVSEDDIASSQTLKSSVVTVTDAAPINAEDITVDITPIQDLHGYDRPWAGGAGKNKLNIPSSVVTTTIKGITYTVTRNEGGAVTEIDANGTATADATIDFSASDIPIGNVILTGCPSDGGNDTWQIIRWNDGWGDTTRDNGSGVTYNNTTASNWLRLRVKSGVTVSHIKFYPMIRLATETDSTFAPYTNICPIEGRTGAELDRVGKNWFTTDANDYEAGTIDPSTGALLNDSNYKRTKEYLPIRAGSYKLINAYNFRIFVYDSNKNYLGYVDGASVMTISNLNVAFYKARWPANNDMSTAMLFLSSFTDSTYEPYQGEQYTASFGETVYGGKWHVTEGGTDKTYGYVEFDGSDDEGWTAESVGWSNWDYLFYTNVAVLPDRTWRNDNHIYVKSNKYNGSSYNGIKNNATGNEIAIVGSQSNKIEVAVASSMSLSDFKSSLASNPLQVVYELATPTIISTPKQNVPMLQGINTVSADCGDVSLKYQPNNVIGELKGEIEKINSVRPKVYGFHIDSNESDPSAAVTYLQDAVGMRPAKMDYIKDVFDYGSWEDVWFVRDCKPCVLHKNGYVISYLDKNDFSKDIYGDPVYLSIPNHQVMIEFPKIWYKVVPDLNDSSSASVYISPVKLDEDYVDFAYIDSSGTHKEHFYMSAYNACAQTESGTRYLCSLSGQVVSKSLTGQNEIDACKALGTGWYTEDAGEIILINFLLILMGKSTDTKSVFGQGLHTGGSEAINDGFRTGVHDTKGMFYGTNSGAIASNNYNNAVKIFGIENYWGFQWRRYAGDMLVDGHRKIKLCYGNDDGSSTKEFNSTGDGYVDIGCTPSGTSGGYINKMKYTSNGMFSSVSSGTASTYYCSGQWYNNSGTMYAFRGGDSINGAPVGAFSVNLNFAFGSAGWYFGASPSYK